jgi:hypothetical protein
MYSLKHKQQIFTQLKIIMETQALKRKTYVKGKDNDFSEYDSSQRWSNRLPFFWLTLSMSLGLAPAEWLVTAEDMQNYCTSISYHYLTWGKMNDNQTTLIKVRGRQNTGCPATSILNTDLNKDANEFCYEELGVKPLKYHVEYDADDNATVIIDELGDVADVFVGDDNHTLYLEADEKKMREIPEILTRIGFICKTEYSDDIENFNFCSKDFIFVNNKYVVTRQLDKFLYNTPYTKAVANPLARKYVANILLLKQLARAEGMGILSLYGENMPIISDYAHNLMRNTEDISENFDYNKTIVKEKDSWWLQEKPSENGKLNAEEIEAVKNHYTSKYGITRTNIDSLINFLNKSGLYDSINFGINPLETMDDVDDDTKETWDTRVKGLLTESQNGNSVVALGRHILG